MKKKTKPKAQRSGPDLSKIAAELRQFAVPVGSLTPDPENARKHDDRSIDEIARSLSRFTQQKPILFDERGVVRIGNGTLAAAVKLGWTHVAAIRSSLSPAELKAYAIADNRTAEFSTWDAERLAAQLDELNADGLASVELGFTDAELATLLVGLDREKPTPAFQPAGEETQSRLDQRKPVICPHCQKSFVPE